MKRGQIPFIVIVGIIILGLLAFAYYYKNAKGPTLGGIPIIIPPVNDFTDKGDSIFIRGSWIEDSGEEAAWRMFPDNTVLITCFKEKKCCIESRSVVNAKTHTLLIFTMEYGISNWTDRDIEASLDDENESCVLRIDRLNKATRLKITSKKAEGSPFEAHIGIWRNPVRMEGVQKDEQRGDVQNEEVQKEDAPKRNTSHWVYPK